ncbi:collagenase-like protein with putative collagen-binding domain [Aureibacillus halotolerans]|uniref:Collagenase-like protein with putative collagen-binding domain n=2 Tax=Aureibacillus halotolerans TaxID=1508390 RepID=A0A4R6TQN0_9BACI|nr:collagenase-like protein with putative collagen-binding domain [Aureibacillus halotolerans]
MQLIVDTTQQKLARKDGQPFFWLGDTAWELVNKLTLQEIEHYLSLRAQQGFTVIQTVVLAEMNGLKSGNAYGRMPLKQNSEGMYDPMIPDVDEASHYWTHLDAIMALAEQFGLYIALLPTWGDKFNLAHGIGPVIFNEHNAFDYGQWLGERYKHRDNLVWVLGGDRKLETYAHFSVVRRMAQGLRAGGSGRHLQTFHPAGEQSSSLQVHDEHWLDFNMIQSGHGKPPIPNHRRVLHDIQRMPSKPTLDAEPCYEDLPIAFNPENGYFDASDTRKAAYCAVLAGAFGHTYGHQSVWCMNTVPDTYSLYTWKEALQRPGAWQMRHVRTLMMHFSDSKRQNDTRLLIDNPRGANEMIATRGLDFSLVYNPNGLPMKVYQQELTHTEQQFYWYDPRLGHLHKAVPKTEGEVLHFRPPSSGRGHDWVLIAAGSKRITRLIRNISDFFILNEGEKREEEIV